MPSRSSIGPSNFDQSSPSDTKTNGVRVKAIGGDGQGKYPESGVVSTTGTKMGRSASLTIQPWIDNDPKIAEWYRATAKKAKGTAQNYSRLLSLYWQGNARFRAFKNTGQWLAEVNEQQNSPEISVRRTWGKELQEFFWTYKTKEGDLLASKSQNNLRAAVLHFFRFHIGEPESFEFTLGTQDQLKKEATQREDETPPSPEDLRAIYNQCRTNRDRALVLSIVNGFGLSEWIDFAKSWHRYKVGIEAGTVPLRIEIPFRSKTLRKTKVDSYTLLWDDCVQSLKELLEERKRELGHDLTAEDILFASEIGNQLGVNTIELLFRNLATRAGLHKKLGRIQRLRPHKIGRTFFATEAVNAGVDPAVREFVLMHTTDKFGGAYVAFHKTTKGQEIIQRELAKLRPVLNIVSGRGNEVVSEEDVRTKAAKETYKTLLEAGLLKPETLSLEVLKTIAQRLGLSFEKLVFAGDIDTIDLPEDIRMRLGYFDLIAGSVDLSTETFHRYMDAIKVQRPTKAKSAWENHDWLWLRVEVGSDDYMAALAEGYAIVDREDNGMRILRKPKISFDDKAESGVAVN